MERIRTYTSTGVCVFSILTQDATEAPLKVNILRVRGRPPQPPTRAALELVWLIYLIELKNSYLVHKYLHRNSQTYVLKNFKSGIYLSRERYDLYNLLSRVLTRFFVYNLNQNILGIAGNKTYIMFQPDVAVTHSPIGIQTNMIGSFLASSPLVCAKLKI